MSLRDIQQSIAQWGRETFGKPGLPPPAGAIAARMNVEVAELLVGLSELSRTPPGSKDRHDAVQALGVECADIGIMLVQVADALGIDLQDAIAEKMVINRARVWTRLPSGKVQHVEPDLTACGHSKHDACHNCDGPEFVEEASGATLRRDKWYLVWDAGGLATLHGFDGPERAQQWARGSSIAMDLPEPVLPTYRRENGGFTGTGALNIMFGEHLYLHQMDLKKASA